MFQIIIQCNIFRRALRINSPESGWAIIRIVFSISAVGGLGEGEILRICMDTESSQLSYGCTRQSTPKGIVE